MKVILQETISTLGNVGDLIDVRDGYARNYLLPQKKATKASMSNMKALEHQKRLIQSKVNKSKLEAKGLVDKLEAFSCTIAKQVGENEKLYGSVTAMDIELVLKQEGFQIDKRQILLTEPIKALGLFTVNVKVHTEFQAKLKVWVVQK